MSSGTLARRYRGDRYWEKEQGRTVKTDKVRVVFYPIAGKLQISGAWKSPQSGKVAFGRTAVCASDIASNPEALALLEAFVNAARS